MNRPALLDRPASTLIPERWRWRIAYALAKLPSFCWADLVGWVQNEDRGEYKLRWARGWACTRPDGGLHCGTCYCGKRRTVEADRAMRNNNGAAPGVIVDPATGRPL
jgi:hypothetical protein